MSSELKFFTPSRENVASRRYGTRPLAHAVAHFYTRGPHAVDAEWLIVADDHGFLVRARADRRASLPQSVLQDFAHNELLVPPFELDVASLSLFGIAGVEASTDVHGLNDPVVLAGTLVGPIPSDAPSAIDGRLTVTRGDLLAAAIRGAPHAFHCTASPDSHIVQARWHHLLLPGGTEDELRAGRGVVLAVPISRAELEVGHAGNEDQLQQILIDTLVALRADALRSQNASKRKKADRSVIKRLFAPERAAGPAPSDKGLDALIAAASEALALVPAWPTARAEALAERLRIDEAIWMRDGARGLTPIGRTEIHEGALVVARPRNRKLEPIRLAFAVDPSFAAWHRGDAEIEVDCGDDTGTIDVEYDTASGPKRSSGGAIALGRSGAWRRIVFSAPGARFGQHGASGGAVRLVAEAAEQLRVRKVSVRPTVKRPRPRPTPQSPAVVKAPVSAPTPSVPKIVAATPTAARVFFHEPRSPSGWVHDIDRVVEQAKREGFAVLGAETLERWIEARISAGAPGSVVVLPGYAPASVVESASPSCAVRRYLDRGGRLVWIGDLPFQERVLSDGRFDPKWSPAQEAILEIGPPGPAIKNPPIITDEGQRWGMKCPDVASRTQSVRDVTIVFSRANGRYAASWLKCFNPKYPFSGFLRFRGGIFRGSDSGLVDDLFRVATFGLTSS